MELYDEVIKNVSKVKFYNLSFRCYRGFYKGYVVGIFPFVTEMHEIKRYTPVTGGGSFSMGKLEDFENYQKNVISIFRVHLNDHKNNPKIWWSDPCLFYEDVIGDKIHTEPSVGDKAKFHLPDEFYEKQRQKFNRQLFNNIRKNKLNKMKYECR